MAVLSALIFVCIPQIATEYIFVSIAIGVFAALSEVNQFILLGKQEIKKANNIKLIYPLVSLGYIFVLNLFSLFDSVTDCVIGMAVAYLLSTIVGIYYLKDDYKTLNTENTREKLALSKLLFKLGATKQAGSIAQSMNYRLSFYIIGFYCGESLVGIYSNGISISEAIMLFGTSLALVQYSHLSNNENKTQSKRLTWKMSLINGLFTLLAVLFFALIPTDVYCFVFGEQFGEVRDVIRMLGFGIVLLSTASNFTQYLYARGNFKTTTIASFVGLAATLILGFTLIPRYGIMGAAITASLSYTISFAIEFIVFLKSK
jgi:O-antigen/teichoic acid export membrane protein